MNCSSLYFIILPAFSAVLCPFAAKINEKLADTLTIMALGTGLIAILNPTISMAMTSLNPQALLSGDALSRLLILVIYMVAFCCAFYAAFSRNDLKRRPFFFSLLLICVAAMSGICVAADYFTLYVYLEIAAVSSFALIAFDENMNSVEGAVKYLLLSTPASALILAGIAVLLFKTGNVSFQSLESLSAAGETGAFLLSTGLMAAGFLIKAGVVPFHGWTPDAYQSAPDEVSALLSGIVTKAAGVYPLVRICMSLAREFPDAVSPVGNALMFFGALSVVGGALAAVYQTDLKRMLAFSSISQVGYIVLAAGLGTPLALLGAVFHLFNHATFKTVLFLNAASINSAAGQSELSKLSGLEKKMPWTSWTTIVALLSTAGIPPLSGFWSKVIIIFALWKGGAPVYAAIALFASVITLTYFIVMQKRVFFGKPSESAAQIREARPALLAPSVLLAALIIIIGLYFPVILNTMIMPILGDPQ